MNEKRGYPISAVQRAIFFAVHSLIAQSNGLFSHRSNV